MQIIPGDLVFFLKTANMHSINGDKDTTFVDAVCLSSTSTKVNHQVFHVGLFISSTEIIHATSFHGVIKESLTNAIISIKPGIIEIYRTQCSNEKRQNAVKFAYSALGAKYNDIFSPNFINSDGEKAYYCCQFICAAYGRDMFNPHSLNFLDGNGKMMEYWIAYFEKRNVPIPQGLPGSHPSIIKNSKCLNLIKVFKISKDFKIVDNENDDNGLDENFIDFCKEQSNL